MSCPQRPFLLAVLLGVIATRTATAQPVANDGSFAANDGSVNDRSSTFAEHLWQKLATFPKPVETVFFLDLPGAPRVGFVGTEGMVYRTTDGGVTWRTTLAVDDRSSTDDYNFDARDFTFKDSVTGWFANYSGDNEDTTTAQCYKTTDGGLRWIAMRGPARHASSILYRPKQHLLLLSSWRVMKIGSVVPLVSPRSCYSTDEGANWTVFNAGTSLNGFAFLNDTLGVATSLDQFYLHTADGGFTWNRVSTTGTETWQPLADPIRNVFCAAAELGGKPNRIFESADGGVNFKPINILPYITGTIRMSSCGLYYLQSGTNDPDAHRGILQSNDDSTWTPMTDANGISGSVNVVDTRFDVKGSYIHAGGFDGSVWRYIGDSTKYGGARFVAPIASTKIFRIQTTACNDLDSTLYAVFHNDCLTAQLVSARIEPVGNFVVYPREALPHVISGDYPIRIEYRPRSLQADTASLLLSYDVSGTITYDTVLLIGEIVRNPGKPAIDLFVNQGKVVSVVAGDTVSMSVKLLSAIPGNLAPDSIEFETSFDRDQLSYVTINVLPPWSLMQESHGEGMESVAVRHKPGEDLLANSEIVEMLYKCNIARATRVPFKGPPASGTYSFKSLRFNDSLLAGCIQATALLTPATISVSACGDTTMRSFMAGNLSLSLRIEVGNDGRYALRLQSLETGPRVPFKGPPAAARLEIDNVLGQCVLSNEVVEIMPGTQLIPLNEEKLPSGLYFVRLNLGDRPITAGRFVIAK